MIMSTTVKAMCWVVFSSLLALEAGAREKPTLLLPGQYHGDEVSAKSGEIFLILDHEEGKCRLRKTRLVVKKVRDQILDEGNKRTGKSVSTPTGNPVFMIRGIPAIKAGPAITAVVYSRPQIVPTTVPLTVTLKNTTWTVQALPTGPKKGPDLTEPVRLFVKSNSIQRELINLPQGMDPDHAKGIRWIGDVDGDGQPDVLMDISNHYNISEMVLLLSSEGSPQGPYRIVATFKTVGC
jgi:hypothetical protein